MRLRYLAVLLALSLSIWGCSKSEDHDTITPTGPSTDLTHNDCIGCHTSEASLRATATVAAAATLSKFGGSGNHIAGEG